MMTTILSTALSAAMLATSALCMVPASPAPLTQSLPANNYVSQSVSVDQTLGQFAQQYYGDENQWTTVWNDNPWIEDPDSVKAGWVLAVRSDKPVQPEALAMTVKFKADEKERVADEAKAQEQIAPAIPVLQATVQIAPQPVAPTAGPKVLSDDQLNFLGSCEAGLDPAKNTGNGYYGAFQFSYGTWKSMNTGYERADLAPLEVQKEAVQRLVSRSSIHTQFPGCASRMRNAGMI
jgi:hypothetical protein